MNHLFDTIIENYVDERYYLIYADYDDRLTDSDITSLMEKGVDGLYDDSHFLDWLLESQGVGAMYEADQALEKFLRSDDTTDELREWVDENHDDLIDALRDTISDRDYSNPLKDLASNSGSVTLMAPLVGEDDAEWGEHRKASQLMAALGTEDRHHYAVARELIADAPTDLGMAYVAFSLPVIDLVEDALVKGSVVVQNPVVIYGNPFTGGVWDATFEGATYTTDVSNVKRDGAWGYSLEDIYGWSPCSSQVDVMLTPGVESAFPQSRVEYMDTLGEYIEAVTD